MTDKKVYAWACRGSDDGKYDIYTKKLNIRWVQNYPLYSIEEVQHVIENNDYDTFDSSVVIANTADEARKIIPSFDGSINEDGDDGMWAKTKDVKVELVGRADEKYLANMHGKVNVISSFNAG